MGSLSLDDIRKRFDTPKHRAIHDSLSAALWLGPEHVIDGLARVLEGEPISESVARIPFLKALFEGGTFNRSLFRLMTEREKNTSGQITRMGLAESLLKGDKGHGAVVSRIRAYMGDEWMAEHSHVRDAGPIKARDINEILKEAERRGDIKVTCYVCGKEPSGRQVFGFYMLPDPEGAYTRPGKDERISVIRICDPCKKLGMETVLTAHRVRARVLGEHS